MTWVCQNCETVNSDSNVCIVCDINKDYILDDGKTTDPIKEIILEEPKVDLKEKKSPYWTFVKIIVICASSYNLYNTFFCEPIVEPSNTNLKSATNYPKIEIEEKEALSICSILRRTMSENPGKLKPVIGS